MQLAFEEQEELLAPSTGSPRRHSFESPPLPIDQDCVRGWSEELQSSSRLCSQVKEKKGPREQWREKRQHQDGGINSGIHHSESSDHGHDTNEDDDEGGETPRPAKQRRLSPVSPEKPPTPSLEQS